MNEDFPNAIIYISHQHFPKTSVMNISQIKHTWFSFVFLFVTDLSNYNAVVFTGKKACQNGRRTSVHSEHEKGITELSINGKSHKEY